ncbi:MAG: type III-A CRISPR-associated RAMP protein Csm4 [Firmicutes bacterium]|nr:type III-A CRISPR-associated RAMP protein Csm4 [Bacillota bacterium]
MNYALYKLSFNAGVHIGCSSLEDSETIIHADTVFSAMCHQALKIGGEKHIKDFVNIAAEGRFLISDAFPYIGDTFYIPKPMIAVQAASDEGNSVVKKQFKKMKFIPVDKVDEYINGSIDAEHVNEEFKLLGKKELRTHASIKGEEETKPYHVGVYNFDKGNGLYIIIGWNSDSDKIFADELLKSLQYDGIGGERTSGLGRFEMEVPKMPQALEERLGEDSRYSYYMNLSAGLPSFDELERVVKGASYTLLRRGGFVASENYAQEHRRKKDMYVFQPGSVFSEKFDGQVFDVSSGGSHSVYRYAKPIWMGVKA